MSHHQVGEIERRNDTADRSGTAQPRDQRAGGLFEAPRFDEHATGSGTVDADGLAAGAVAAWTTGMSVPAGSPATGVASGEASEAAAAADGGASTLLGRAFSDAHGAGAVEARNDAPPGAGAAGIAASPAVVAAMELATFGRSVDGYAEVAFGLRRDVLDGLRVRIRGFGQGRVGVWVERGADGILGDDVHELVASLRERGIDVVEFGTEQ